MTEPHYVGDRRLAITTGTGSGAVFGGERQEYRYRLRRDLSVGETNFGQGSVLVVMMNPSTADDTVNDNTVAKVSRMARGWGFATLLVGNTFAYRATDQRRLLEVEDPIGPDNDAHLVAMAREADLVIFAYGRPPKSPALRARGPAVARMIQRETGKAPHVLWLSRDATPRHPLYLKDATRPVPWEVPPE